jgi:hypothetical protein
MDPKKKGSVKSLEEAFYALSSCSNAEPGKLNPQLYIVDNPEYLFWRGRVYILYTDYKRALYDFSGAIRLSMR